MPMRLPEILIVTLILAGTAASAVSRIRASDPAVAGPQGPITRASVDSGHPANSSYCQDFYFEGKSVRQIADARRLSERAVEGRLRRAREKLKRKIERLRPRAARRVRGATGEADHVQPTRTS